MVDQKDIIIEYAELKYDLGYQDGFTAGFISMGCIAGIMAAIIFTVKT